VSLLGGQDLIVVVLVIALLFGAKRLPELGKSLGEGIKEFKKSATGVVDDETSATTSEQSERPKSE
jgi:sec-independent protein translocase protein TatA